MAGNSSYRLTALLWLPESCTAGTGRPGTEGNSKEKLITYSILKNLSYEKLTPFD